MSSLVLSPPFVELTDFATIGGQGRGAEQFEPITA